MIMRRIEVLRQMGFPWIRLPNLGTLSFVILSVSYIFTTIGFGLLLLLTFPGYMRMASAGTIAPSGNASRNLFAADLFKTIVSSDPQTNIVYSPASIQSCLALAYIGAGGATAEEFRKGLRLGAVAEKNNVAQNYGEFLQNVFHNATPASADAPQLRMANRIYVNEGLQIAPKFNEIAGKYFRSEAQSLRFADAGNAVKTINSWVEDETQSKIRNLLRPDSVNAQTSAILVNAIYFKALWLNPFSESSTHKADFALNTKQKVPVDMMYLDDHFKYADLGDLDATALEMPYKGSKLSMLLILPNKIDGLQALEGKLANVDLNDISTRMKVEDVQVFVPKFSIEFDIDLKQPLKKLGMTSMFGDSADFSDIFTDNRAQKISDVRHKAFLNVNEAGSEAAAATFMKIVPMCLNLNQKQFRADHPFVFAIRDTTAVYFAGHVVRL